MKEIMYTVEKNGATLCPPCKFEDAHEIALESGGNVKIVDVYVAADILVQQGYEMSGDGYNYIFDAEEAAYLIGCDVKTLSFSLDDLRDAMEEDDLVLEVICGDDEETLDINFCSMDLEEGDCNGNILFKFENERWVRRTDEEIKAYRKEMGVAV